MLPPIGKASPSFAKKYLLPFRKEKKEIFHNNGDAPIREIRFEVIAKKRNERFLLVSERSGGGRDHVLSDGVQCETARMREVFFHATNQ